MSIKLTEFGGIVPKVSDRNLSVEYAKVAENVNLEQGFIQPWRGPKKVSNETGENIFEYDCCFVSGACMSSFTRFGIDCHEVVIATGISDNPVFSKWDTCPPEWHNLGFDVAYPAPTVSLNHAVPKDFTVEARSYVYTLVNCMGWESHPSEASPYVNLTTTGQTVVSGFPTDLPADIESIKIYRTETALDFGVQQPAIPVDGFFYAGTIDVGTEYFFDFIDVAGEELVTDAYDPAPLNLRQVAHWREGRLLGLSGNYLVISERHKPYAFNNKNRISFYDEPVRLVASERSAYVLTCGKPVFVELNGDCKDGEKLTRVTEVPVFAPIVSNKSAVNYLNGAVFASETGLFMVEGLSVKNLTQDYYTASQWQSLLPNTMSGAIHEGYYYGVTDRKTIRFKMPDAIHNQASKFALTTLTLKPRGMFVNDRGRLYMALDDGTYEWNQGTEPLPMRWHSKVHTLPGRTKYSAYKVVAQESGNVITTLVDTKQLASKSHRNNKPVRLPLGYKGLDWQFKIEGTATVYEYHISTSVMELSER